jgi:SAM-dependent methyltransferase
MAATSATVDAASWLGRWDAQQQLHIPEREERFSAIVQALAAFAGDAPRVLDLGCGPGSLSARVLARLPDAEIVAIDSDPVLLEIGRLAFAGQPRLHFVDADLRGDWIDALPLPSPFDAAVSTTALHWLRLPELVDFYATLAAAIRPGGVLLNGDRLDFDHDQRTIGQTAQTVQPDWGPTPEGAEDWDAWWTALEADPSFADLVAERRRRRHEHPRDEEGHTYEFHRAALLSGGFTEVGTIWQRLVDRVLVAVR